MTLPTAEREGFAAGMLFPPFLHNDLERHAPGVLLAKWFAIDDQAGEVLALQIAAGFLSVIPGDAHRRASAGLLAIALQLLDGMCASPCHGWLNSPLAK